MSEQGQTVPQGVDLAQAYLDLIEQVKAAKAENARLKAGRGHKLTVKLSDKGCICVYGLGRFPLSLYKSQWQKFWASSDDVKAEVEAMYASAPDKAD